MLVLCSNEIVLLLVICMMCGQDVNKAWYVCYDYEDIIVLSKEEASNTCYIILFSL